VLELDPQAGELRRVAGTNFKRSELSDMKSVIVAGLGEVGGPLLKILSRNYQCVGVDIQPVPSPGPCSVLHICFPFQIPDFVGTTVRYALRYQPELIIINSTIAPGTTLKVAAATSVPVAYSPVRGKHAKMENDMLFYRKFVGADDAATANAARMHFEGAGFRTGTFPNAAAGETAKLLETTWLGVLVGWAQEVERIAARYGANYEDMNAFTEEIAFLPQGIFPGVIGGHCVMSNIAILRSVLQSDFLDAVVKSNAQKASAVKQTAMAVNSNG
jgi:UDP-N-acetyl-D-mannosaminuronate dehydrogenase